MEGDLRSSSSDISDSSETASNRAVLAQANGTPKKKGSSGSASNSPKPNKALKKREAAKLSAS